MDRTEALEIMRKHRTSATEVMACAKREVKMREGAYPRWVNNGKMKRQDAERELRSMRAAAEFICKALDGLEQQKLNL